MSTPSGLALAPGARLGSYAVTAKLGAGGMGEVWRATDTRLGRDVALKVLPAGLADDPERHARFEREAKVLASLNHPNIATLFGLEHLEVKADSRQLTADSSAARPDAASGNAGHGPRATGHDVERASSALHVLVMELVEGEDLAQRLQRGAIPVGESIAIARQIAEALEAAHAKGIVHRDLKPANVKLRPDGTVKVLDFGLARAWEREPAAAGLANSPTVTGDYTRAGQVLGTAAYMSPEQARGGAVDGRADIWAFGVVLFELLAGRRPFDGRTLPDIFAGVITAEPPWEALPAALPPAVRALLARCLTRDVRRRLQSIAEARITLEEAAAGGVPVAAPPTPRRGPRLGRRELAAWTLAVAAGLALVVVLGLGVPRRDAPVAARAARRFALPPPPFGGFENALALSRDGSRLAFVAPGPTGEDMVWLRPLAEVAPRALAGTEGASFPFWSPDGNRLAFFAKGKVKTYELSGGRVQTLCAAPKPRGGSWSRDGTLLLSIDVGGSLVRVAAEGGAPTAVIDPEGEVDAGSFRFPAFLPDGLRFLCFRFAGAAQMGIWVGSLSSRELTFLVESDSGAVFAPPGHLIYRSRERLVAQPFDPVAARLTGPAVTLAEDVWSDGLATILTAFDASETGVLAYRTGGPVRSRLIRYDRSGAESGTIGPVAPYLEPAVSPDGRRVAVTRGAEDGGSSDIWVFDLDRDGATRLTFGAGYSSTPLWTPDGGYLAWASFPSGEVVRRSASGAGKEELLWRNPAFWPLSDFSRDGRHLLFEVLDFRRFTFDVGRVALAGDHRLEPVLAESYSELGARLSPDGRWLAYVSDESGVEEVFVRSYPDLSERLQVSTSGGTQPRWRGDGRELFYVAPDRKLMAVDFSLDQRREVGRPLALFATRILPPIEARNHYDAAPDGRRFVVNSRPADDATAPIAVVLDWSAETEKR